MRIYFYFNRIVYLILASIRKLGSTFEQVDLSLLCDHAIIAAGSVVVKDVPADEVWGGNPAKCIKKRTNG